MRIEHIAIYTKDLERLRKFYEHYFNGASNAKYHNPRTGLSTYFVYFQDGSRLEIMSKPGLREEKDEKDSTVGLTHIAFAVGTKADVDNLTRKLVEDGYPLYSAPRKTGDGYYESCVGDPDGNRLEITADS